MKTKKTLHGVKCEKTKALFTELKKRGFSVHLEDGGHSTFKINTFINGVCFTLSCKGMVYCKNYARGKHEWQSFKGVDDLILVTIKTKKGSAPTDKQLAFISSLEKELDTTVETPETVEDAILVISRLKSQKEAMRYKQDTL